MYAFKEQSLLLQKPFFFFFFFLCLSFLLLIQALIFTLRTLCASSYLPLNCVLSLVTNTPNKYRRENKNKKVVQ